MICCTIEAALQTCLSARILVTRDNEEIFNHASHYSDQGVFAYKRPEALATDKATTADALIEAVNQRKEREKNRIHWCCCNPPHHFALRKMS